MSDSAQVDALYALDPSGFVAARDALAKELKAAGDKDAAAEVKALKRPTKAAWAINQVARSRPDDIDALLAAGRTLRDRQAEALSGGDAGALRDASATRREVVRSLVVDVVALAGDAVRDDAAGTFEAASVDDEIGQLVAAARLSAIIARPSDMGFGGMPDVPGRAASPRRSTRSRTRPAPSQATGPPSDAVRVPSPPVRLDRRRIQKLQRTLATAERDAAAADDALADAERRLARADDALAAAEDKRAAAVAAQLEAAARHERAAAAVLAARADLDAFAAPD